MGDGAGRVRDRKNRVLGDAVVLCGRCGFARRYMLGGDPPGGPCPDCGARLLEGCAACGAPVESVMQVDCRACGAPLRTAEAFGVPVRRKPEPASGAAVRTPGDDA